MLEFDQNILSEKNVKHLLISKQQRDKSEACFVEGWDLIPKQNAEFHNNMIDCSSPFSNQLFWQYLCLAKHFRSHVILKLFGEQYSQWHPSSTTPPVSCSPTFRLHSCNSWNCSLEMVEDPTMTSHILSGLYHWEIGGCMGICRSQVKFWNLADAGRQLKRQRNVPSWQRYLGNWCCRETWLYHIIKGSHRQSHLLIHLSSLF